MPVRRGLRTVLLAGAVLLGGIGAACGGGDDGDEAAAGTTGATAPATTAATAQATAPTAPAAPARAANRPFGADCGEFAPGGRSGPRRIAGESTRIALFLRPGLRDITALLTGANRLDTPGLTMFLPIDRAIDALSAEERRPLVGDPVAVRAWIDGHLVRGRPAPSALAGEHTTLAGTTVAVSMDGADVTVGDRGARVVCGNIRTADATIHLIDGLVALP